MLVLRGYLVLSIGLSHHKRPIGELDWFWCLWLNDHAIGTNPPVRILTIDNWSNGPSLVRRVLDHNCLSISRANDAVENCRLIFASTHFRQRVSTASSQGQVQGILGTLVFRLNFWNFKMFTFDFARNSGISQVGRDRRRVKRNIQWLLHARWQVAHCWIDRKVWLQGACIPGKPKKFL